MTQAFVHLHLHTQFSLLDGMIKADALMDRCLELDMPAVAITDHGNMHGVLKFYKAAKDKGVKPILGAEVYVAGGDRRDRSPGQPSACHLVLLAETDVGYSNLIHLVSQSHLEGLYYKPRCDRELLEQYNEGLIAMSACLQGEVARAIIHNEPKKARDAVDFYRSVFPGRYYIEIQENGVTEQAKANEGLVELAREFDLPLVATNDCHYLKEEHAPSHEVLLCVQTGKTLADPDRMRFSTNAFFVKSPAQMAALFPDHPQALTNTLEIAERCNTEFKFGNFIYPRFDLPKGQTPDSALEKMARQNLKKRLPALIKDSGSDKDTKTQEKQYKQRLESELALIKEKGFSSYFLIVQDFINWARERNIPVGPGRGSAAGSLVSYVLRITDIEPIRYGLLFERFMNPERTDNPDIDIDFCANGRDRVIEYTSEKYGKDCVAQISTFGTLKARAVVRDVGRAMGYTYGEVDRIAKMIPDELGITLDEAVRRDRELKKTLQEQSWVAELIDHARVLEGLNRHASTHAAGVVIANKPLVEYLPLTKGTQGEIVAQWDKKDVESIGLIKFDFLGLKTLTVIDNALRLIKQGRGVTVDLAVVPMDEPETFDLLTSARTTGVFQLESRGMRDLLMRLKPTRIDELIALVALYRPGPIGSGMIDNFINRKHGREQVTYEIPALKEHLAETYGMMVYQEQVMQVANAVGGFTLGDADLLRRAMSKKNHQAMARHKTKFLEGATQRNIAETTANKIWDLMAAFAAYGFNKSHSAAYGVLAYQTAYLKTHYPVEFMAALLTMDSDNSDKLMASIAETREMGIEVLPPDVNESEAQFSVREGAIRYGLAGVKNVGLGAIEAIREVREKVCGFRGLLDFCDQVDASKVNRRVVESLIRAGAFDSINPNRAQLIKALDMALERAARIQRDRLSGQMGLFGVGCSDEEERAEDTFEDCAPWGLRERLQHEKEVLGFFLTGHPLQQFADAVEKFADHDSQELAEMAPTPSHGRGIEVRIAGIITARRFFDTSKGRMVKCRFEDLKGSHEMVVFSQTCERCYDKVNSDEPLLVVGHAKRDEDSGVDIIAQEIYFLKDAKKILSKEAHFFLQANRVDEDKLDHLKRLIGRFPGRCRPVIHVTIPGKSVVICRLTDKYLLDPSDDLVEEASRLFGKRSLSLR